MNIFKVVKSFFDNLPPAIQAELKDICILVYTECKNAGIARLVKLLNTK